MRTTKHFLYVVYIPEGETRTCLDAIRLIARPQLRFAAHVTIRGPYGQPLHADDVAALSEKVRGKVVRVGDVGTFPPPNNVAFLHCSCPDFLSVWHKPDFGYNPHVTLYNGESWEFTEAVAEVIDRHPIRFSFRAAGLDLIVSDKASTVYAAREQYDPQALSEILGESLSLEEIDSLETSQRLDWISRVANHLSKIQRAAIPA